MMKHVCPHCKRNIHAPLLSQYEESFRCPHCQQELMHDELDILIYAFVAIILFSTIAVVVLHLHVFIALSLALLLYHFIRPRFIESHFRLRSYPKPPTS
ncbi:hypothetical protein [Photobacterium sanguinicancri]|uniref:hypothetical protein n=1 Tax=Photobacterium sanguinicancri TaxID=875932 RepID=UPI0026E2C836|nr:hypothetical protein [Photobacterium sanguinicancri]MDO6497525.1 hypothetical protein [Photobacterium sanguinicancri]